MKTFVESILHWSDKLPPICWGILYTPVSFAAYVYFLRFAVKKRWVAKRLQLGLLEILKDSIIAFIVAMGVVWYSFDNPLIKIDSSKEKYIAASDRIINQEFASFCNWLVNFESDWESIFKFYLIYLAIFVVPYIVALGVHVSIKVLPKDDNYRESEYSAFFLKTRGSLISDLFCISKFLFDLFVIKTPIAIGGIFCSYEIYIFLGYIKPEKMLHPTFLALLPVGFFIPTITSQIIFVLISHKKWISDKKNIPTIARLPNVASPLSQDSP